jgi:DNA-binding XRE family transcriptional regulator
MGEFDRVLARNVEQLIAGGGRRAGRGRATAADCTSRVIISDLVAARAAAGMTQQDVADRMPSTKSVVSPLESGVRTRPTLTTIERYAQAVGTVVEIRVRPRR